MTYGDLSALGFDSAFNVEHCREPLLKISDAGLISFGKQMHSLFYLLTYDFQGKADACMRVLDSTEGGT